MVLQAIITILFCLFLVGMPVLQWLNLRTSTKSAEAAIASAKAAHEAVAAAREAIAVAQKLAERQT